jgi:calcineurin-like phosphoesterase family protein
LAPLHGRKHRIVGNNDDAVVTHCMGWATVRSVAELTVDGSKLVLCHYPFRTWRDMERA